MGAGLSWYFREAIFNFLIAPADGQLSPHGGLPIYISLTEVFSATVSLMWKGAVVAALPALLFTVFRMVSPMLNRRERRAVAIFVPVLILFFLSGVAFAYFALLPVGIAFLLGFGEGIAVPTISLAEYLKLALTMLFWMGVIFELPPLMFLLSHLRVIKYHHFKKIRKFVPPSAAILGAILSPGFDLVNAGLVAVPIVVLYEVGLMLAWLAQPGKGSLMLRTIKAFVFGVFRRVRVVLALAPALLIGLVYVVALTFVYLWDGSITETRSPLRKRVDGAYRRALGLVARVAFLRQRPVAYTDCLDLAKGK